MRLLPLLLSCLALGACAKRTAVPPSDAKLGRFHAEPLDAQTEAQRRGTDSAYGARVRAELTQQSAVVEDCYARSGGAQRPSATMVSAPLYVAPGATYFPRHASSLFMASFERCLLAALQRWPLPRPVERYEAAWVRFHFVPTESAPPEGDLRSALFSREGTLALLEISGSDSDFVASPRASVPQEPQVPSFDAKAMTLPKLVSGSPRPTYSPQTLALGVRGVRIVRCVLTVEGALQNCRIVKPLPYLEREVLGNLYARRYTPVTFKGQPVKFDYTFTFMFDHRGAGR
jgi:hypothetical protein